MAKKQFKAESKRLLDLMINSIYTHKEIFLREIISNASDACDKLCYLALTDSAVGMNRKDFKIELKVDKEPRILTVSDNGIGMDRADLENHLGVIASSGSYKFKQEVGDDAKDTDVIGQFGVGFYSAFMVADHITVVTKKYGSDTAYQWQSSGADGYTITECERAGVGTDIGLITLCNGVAIRAGGLPLISGVAAELPGTDRHLIADHEGGVEAHAELADHVGVLGVISHLLLELVGTGGGDDAQIVLQILLVHADAVIRNGNGTAFFIYGQVNFEILPGQLHAVIRQGLVAQLVAGIAGVGENLPEKNLLMGINGVDHQVQQTLGLRLELFLCHEQNTSFVYFNIEYIVARTAKKEITFL